MVRACLLGVWRGSVGTQLISLISTSRHARTHSTFLLPFRQATMSNIPDVAGQLFTTTYRNVKLAGHTPHAQNTQGTGSVSECVHSRRAAIARCHACRQLCVYQRACMLMCVPHSAPNICSASTPRCSRPRARVHISRWKMAASFPCGLSRRCNIGALGALFGDDASNPLINPSTGTQPCPLTLLQVPHPKAGPKD